MQYSAHDETTGETGLVAVILALKATLGFTHIADGRKVSDFVAAELTQH